MKKVIILLTFLALISCKKDDEVEFYIFTGQILEHPNLTPSRNTEVILFTTAFRESAEGSFEVAKTRTDDQGKYQFEIQQNEFSKSLFVFTDYPSYSIRVLKKGFVAINPIITTTVTFPLNGFLEGENPPIMNVEPSDYFDRKVILGREAFLRFDPNSLEISSDSIHLCLYNIIPDTINSGKGVNVNKRTYIFHDGYEGSNSLLPDYYYLRNFYNPEFPLDTTVIEKISYDTNERLFADWIQFFESDSLHQEKEISLVIGDTVKIFN